MVQPGDRDNFNGDMELTAPTGGVERGKIYAVNDVNVVARAAADAGDSFLAAVGGSVIAEKATGTGKAFTRGDAVYEADNVADVDGTGAVFVGYALRDAGVADEAVFLELSQSAPE